MSKKITILPQIKILKCLTPVEKQVASEIARFTDQGKWFFKNLENFALELGIKKGTLKNVYVKFTKLEWLEKNRIGRTFEYEMTKKFFDFVEECESKNNHIFANFSRKAMTDKLPNNDRIMTDKLPNNDQSIIKITYPSSVEAPNKVSNVLNNESIKDLNNEKVKPLSTPATLSKIEILKDEIQANPLYPKIISLYPKIPSERLEIEIEFALTKFIELGRTSGAFSYIKSYLSNADFKDVLTNKKLEIEDEINSRRKSAYDNKISSNSGNTGFNSFCKTEIIEVDPIQFATRELFEQKIDELKTQNKEFKRREITSTVERFWSENESELVQNKPKSRFEITEIENQKTTSETRTPMQILMEGMKKANPNLAQKIENGAKNPFTKIAQKLVQN